MLIAIDGPAGAGKSTLARRLALELGLSYLNTGLMYRAVTAAALRSGVDVTDGDSLATVAAGIRFELEASGGLQELAVDGSAPGAELAAPGVEAAVSAVAAHRAVRAILRDEQRRLSAGGGVVEGRDIGSVVRPDADVKLFLTAPTNERAVRRSDERGADRGPVAEALRERDALDSRVSPFVPAVDAIEIDTSDKGADAVFREALARIRAAVAG
jgi:cytidylate kinase